MDNIRNELIAEIQQLKNNQDLQKEMDRQSKSEEVNKVINIKLNNHTWTFNRKHFSYKKEPNEKNNFQKIATAAKKMILNSTVHGVARISRSENYLVKALWAKALLISLSGGLYLIQKNINEYKQYDIVTKVRSIKDNVTIFPAVTICMKNDSEVNITRFKFKSLELFKLDEIENTSHLEHFDLNKQSNGECIRFNGYGNNRKKLIELTTNTERLIINFKTRQTSRLAIYISDNYLNNYVSLKTYYIPSCDRYIFYISKTVENKLESPYNPCKTMTDKTYRQANCIDNCQSQKIANLYNCSYRGYYTVKGRPT